MTNAEAAKKLVELYGILVHGSDGPYGEYAEAVAMAAAALVYNEEVKPNVNTSGNS